MLKRSKLILTLILALMLIVGAATAFSRTPWQGHEADYLDVIRFWLDNGRLPTQEDYPNGDAEVRQATQPPLFFAAALPIVALTDDRAPAPPGLHPNAICVGAETLNSAVVDYPTNANNNFPPRGSVAALYGMRLLNLAFGILTVIVVYATARLMFRDSPAVALLAAALIAFEPQTMLAFTTVSNDSLLILLAALNLYLCIRAVRSGKLIYILPILLVGAAAVMTRLPGWAILGFDVAFTLIWLGMLVLRAGRHMRRERVRAALIAAVAVIVLIAAVGAFNYSQYGSVFGRYEQLDRLITSALRNLNISWATFVGVLDQTRLSYLEPLDAVGPRAAFRVLYTLIAGGALIAGLIAAVRAFVARRNIAPYAMLLGLIAISAALVIFRNTIQSSAENTTIYSTALIFAPLRYYAPALPAVALLMAAGVIGVGTWIDQPAARRVLRVVSTGGALVLAAVWLTVGALNVVNSLVNRPPVETLPVSAFETLNGITRLDAPADQAPRILGYRAEPDADTGMIALTIYAADDDAAAPDVQHVLQLDLGTGNLCQTLPARGTTSTDQWAAGTVTAFTVHVPNCAAPLTDPSLTARWLTADLRTGALTGEISTPQDLGTLDGTFETAESCPTVFGIIGGEDADYRPIQYNAPLTTPRGVTYVPRINWLVLRADQANISTRIFAFTHTETGQRYDCYSSEGARSPLSWQSAEIVYFDQCPFRFPDDAPTGEYTVSVALARQDGSIFPAVGVNGDSLPFFLVPLTTITVTE